MASGSIIYANNTGIIKLEGLKDTNDNYQNDATVTMESLVDEETGVAVTGVSVPLAMPYIATSDGDYQANIPHTAGVTAGRHYLAVVQAIASGGERAQWQEHISCRTRKG